MATITDRRAPLPARRVDHFALVDQRPTRGERFLTYVIVALLLVAISAASLLGGGFFFIPIAALGAAAVVGYFALRRVRTRNPLHNDSPTVSQRYADGQPLGRAEDNEEVCLECEEETRLDHLDDDRIRHPPDRTQVNREGPPPIVPFP